jgi:hypothetical protein
MFKENSADAAELRGAGRMVLRVPLMAVGRVCIARRRSRAA